MDNMDEIETVETETETESESAQTKRKRGRPPLSEEEKARRTAEKERRENDGRRTPKKGRGRPPLTYAERQRNQTKKKLLAHAESIAERAVEEKHSHAVVANAFVPAEETTKIMKMIAEMFDWSLVDMFDAEAVRSRCQLYFQRCVDYGTKPTLPGMAMALGVTTGYLTECYGRRAGRIGDASTILKRAAQSIEVAFNGWMVDGNINPIVAIYLTKNHFGYRDQRDIVVEPVSPLGDLPDQKQLEAKLAQIPEEA